MKVYKQITKQGDEKPNTVVNFHNVSLNIYHNFIVYVWQRLLVSMGLYMQISWNIVVQPRVTVAI